MKLNIKGSLIMLVSLVGTYGVLKILSMVFLLLVGSTANVATSGDITVPAGINTSINAEVTNTSAGFAVFNSSALLIFGLIGLVVILTLFWPMISPYLKTAGKKRGYN